MYDGDLLSKVSQGTFSSSNDTQLDGFRLRLIPPGHLPFLDILCPSASRHLVIDDIPNKQMEDSPEKTESNTSDMTLTDLRGSPLKVQLLDLTQLNLADIVHCNLKEIADFECRPLPVHISRRLFVGGVISCTDMNDDDGFLESIPIWTLTNGKDRMNTALMGTRRFKGGFATMNLSAIGNGNMKSIVSKLSNFPTNWLSSAKSKCDAYSELDLMPEITPQKDGNCTVISARIQLKANWICSHDEQLLKNPPSNANIRTCIFPGWLDERTPNYDKCLNLQVLLYFSTALSTGEMSWTGRGIFQEKTTLEAVKELIKESKSALFLSDRKKFDSNFSRDLDFTEKLWFILKECADNQQLIDCLSAVFSALKTKELRPMIHQDNQSTVARLVRDSCSSQLLMLPRLEGLYPVQIALETGLQYTRRDYVEQFGFLGNASQLLSLMKLDQSLEIQAETLKSLQAVLEVVSLCRNFFKLPQHKITEIARETLNKFGYESNGLYADFHYDFPLKQIDFTQSILNLYTPISWLLKIEYRSKEGKKLAIKMMHLGRKPLCPLISYSNLQKTDEGFSEIDYFCTQFFESCVYFH